MGSTVRCEVKSAWAGSSAFLGRCLHEWLRRQFGLIHGEQERIEGGCSGDKQGALPAGIAMPPLDL
jgi:hypothetical protein